MCQWKIITIATPIHCHLCKTATRTTSTTTMTTGRGNLFLVLVKGVVGDEVGTNLLQGVLVGECVPHSCNDVLLLVGGGG